MNSAVPLALLGLLVASSAGHPLARVGEVELTAADLQERLRELKSQGVDQRPADALELLIDETLLSAQAESDGLAKDPVAAAGIEAARRRLAAAAYLDQELEKLAKVTGAQVEQAFHSGADRVKLDWIVLQSKADAASALGRLASGAKFEEEALRSLDPSTAKQGGAIGWRSRRELEPEIASVAFSSEIDRSAGPVERKLGWAILRVRERHIGTDAELAEAREGLTKFVTEQLRATFRRHVADQLRSRYKTKLDEEFLKSLGGRFRPQGEEGKHVLATIGGRPLLYGDVAASMSALLGNQEGHMSGASVKSEYAWKLADQMLFETAAIEAGFGDSEAVKVPLRRARRLELALAEKRKALASSAPPTDLELESIYKERWAASPAGQGRPCAHILVATRSDAESAAKSIASGRPFGEVAKVKSTDLESGARGGDLGIVTPGRIAATEAIEPDLAKLLRSAEPNQVAGPVKSKAGWHLIRCGSRETVPPPLSAEGRAIAADAVRRERADELIRAQVRKLRSGKKIEVDLSAVGRFASSLGN